jgi:uncharacterized membrane protein
VVTEIQECSLLFTGNVSVQQLNGQRAVVAMSANTDQGWSCSVSPATMVITGGGSQPFEVNVTVPENSLAAYPAQLTVTADAKTAGMQFTSEAWANITVRPYYRVLMEANDVDKDISPGETARFTVKVWNLGNVVDSYDIEILELNELAGKGWEVSLDMTQLARIPVAEYRPVNITVKPPQGLDWSLGQSESAIITLNARSIGAQNDGLTVTQSFPLYIHVNGTDTRVAVTLTVVTAAVVVAIMVTVLLVVARRKRRKQQGAVSNEEGGDAK